MDIYIDKANLISFIKSKSHELFDDCNKLLKKQLNVYFNFPKNELKENQLLLQWITTLSQGIGDHNEIKFDYKEPSRPLKSNSSIGFCATKLTSAYLLEDEETDKFKASGCVLVGNVGEEIEIFNKLFLNQNDYNFEKKWRINGDDFKTWKDLENYSFPLTDVLIIDPFILKNKDTDTDTIDLNLVEYLKIICKDSFTKANIIVVTNPANSDYEYQEIKQKIINALTTVLGKRPKFTLILTRREHDRCILTNYKRIYSGDTFNFWNAKRQKITKGREISYSSLAKRENHNLAIELIKDVQSTIDFLKENNPEYIFGDKASNFLNF
ncbi:hypothetical protein [Polaribacter sp. R77954]|uniref:hypothetical protein n=1 Tax=Polaribacter sp. R77954 TaxID=3093870 RepID=UPI0037CA7589